MPNLVTLLSIFSDNSFLPPPPLGDFWKFLATNLFAKVSQKDCWLLGYFEKDHLNTAVDIFWQLVEKHLGDFFTPTSGHTVPLRYAWSLLQFYALFVAIWVTVMKTQSDELNGGPVSAVRIWQQCDLIFGQSRTQ